MSTTTNNTIDTKTYIANNEDELLILLLRNKTATFSHVALEQVMDWVNDLYSMFQSFEEDINAWDYVISKLEMVHAMLLATTCDNIEIRVESF